MPTPLRLPAPRTFTTPSCQINFRACVKMIRHLRNRFENSFRRRYLRPGAVGRLTFAELREVGEQMRNLADAERYAWNDLPEKIRASAEFFDAKMLELGTECCSVTSREEAVDALAAGRPAVWDSYRKSPKNAFVPMINNGVNRLCDEDSTATVFDALISAHIDTFITTLVPLNDAGAAVIRNAKAARAMRGRPVAA